MKKTPAEMLGFFSYHNPEGTVWSEKIRSVATIFFQDVAAAATHQFVHPVGDSSESRGFAIEYKSQPL